MEAFIYLFLYRTLSGVQNGLGYALPKKRNNESNIRRWLAFTSLVLAISAAALPLILLSRELILPLQLLTITGAVVSIIGSLAVWDNFSRIFNRFPIAIHFWELWITTGVTLCWIALGGNLYWIAAHVYPALLLHKGAVNIGGGANFWRHGTDNPTGKTWHLPIINIDVPRLSLRGRQILAGLSLVGGAIVYIKGYSFTILNLL